MKSEHRHELKTNELQRVTAQFMKNLEPYSNQILIGLVAVSVVAGGAVWFARSAGTANELGWTQLATAQSPEDLANVADEFPDRTVGKWARLLEAEGLLETGIQLAFTDRPAALSDLKKAQESFEKVLVLEPPDEIHDRALYGLARTLETLSSGDTSAAIAAYERLQQGVRSEAYAVLYRQEAANRIEELKKGRGQAFYAWFHEQDPKPQDRAEPLDGLPATGGLPGPDFPMDTTPDEAPAGDGEEAATESPAEPEQPAAEGDAETPTESPAEAETASEPAAPAEPSSPQ